MWKRIGIFAMLVSFSNAAMADPATGLLINCIPDTSLPLTTTCFNEAIGKPFTLYVVAVSGGSCDQLQRYSPFFE